MDELSHVEIDRLLTRAEHAESELAEARKVIRGLDMNYKNEQIKTARVQVERDKAVGAVKQRDKAWEDLEEVLVSLVDMAWQYLDNGNGKLDQ